MSCKSIEVTLKDGQVTVHIVPIDVTLNFPIEAAILLRNDLNKAIEILRPPKTWTH